MKKQKKVAVCISGQMRTYRECYKNLYKNILEPLSPDVFIHTWDDVGASHKEQDVRQSIVSDDEIVRLYSPKRYIIENKPKDASERLYGVRVPKELIEAEPVHHKSALAMFYQIKSCYDLCRDYAHDKRYAYDVIVRVRPDSMFKEKVPKKIVEEVSQDKSVLYFADYAINKDIQVCDKFAIGGSVAMEWYSSVWDYLEDYWKNPLGTTPPYSHRVGERLLKFHMDQNPEIKAKPFFFDMYNLRNDGEKVNYDGVKALKKRVKGFLKDKR